MGHFGIRTTPKNNMDCLISDIYSKIHIFSICLFDYVHCLNPSKGVGFELWYIETYFHTHDNESQK